MIQFKTAVVKYHKPSDLNKKSLSCHSCEGWKLKIKTLAEHVSFEVCIKSLLCVQISLFHKEIVAEDLGPNPSLL